MARRPVHFPYAPHLHRFEAAPRHIRVQFDLFRAPWRAANSNVARQAWIPLFAESAGSPLRSGRSFATLTPRGSLDFIAAARTAIRLSFAFALAFGPSLPALRYVPACSSLKGLLVRQSLCERTNQTLLERSLTWLPSRNPPTSPSKKFGSAA